MELGYTWSVLEGNERDGEPAYRAMRENAPHWRDYLATQWRIHCHRDGSQAPRTLECLERMRRDPVMVRYMLPTLTLTHQGNETLGHGTPEDYDAMYDARRLFERRDMMPHRSMKYHRLAAQLEAGVLGGLPVGKTLPPEAWVSSAAQECYERVFFDVRDRLQDRAWIIRYVLAEMQAMEFRPRTALTIWGRRARLVAYAMGSAEYALWRDGATSDKTQLFLHLRSQLDNYMNGLWEIRREGYDDGLRAFAWLLRQADRIRAGELLRVPDRIETTKVAKRERRQLLDTLLEQVPPAAWRPAKPARRCRHKSYQPVDRFDTNPAVHWTLG